MGLFLTMSSGPLTATSYIFACHYKRGYNLCMLARTDSIQKPFYSIYNSESFKLYFKVVGATDSSLPAIYVHFRNREGGKMAAF